MSRDGIIQRLCRMAADDDAQLSDRLAALDELARILPAGGADDRVAVALATLGGTLRLPRSLRDAAIRALVAANHPTFMAAFMGRLAAPDPELVCAAAKALGIGRYQPAKPALAALATRSPHASVRAAARWALAELAPLSAV